MVVEDGDAGTGRILRRNQPGTRSGDFYNWPDQSFDEMDSTLAVQQYIQQTIRNDYTDIDKILDAPEGQDEGVWKYEHLRQFCLELNGLAVKLQIECVADTCSQMTATEQWIFLCAAHKTPKECSAIDYTRHTLDGAACLLNSNKYFPSRVSIKDSSVAKLGSVCRRVYRIFSHAYFHHRHIFDEFENESYLCRRFTIFVLKYNLMSSDNLIVPILEEPTHKAAKRTTTVYTLATAEQGAAEEGDGDSQPDSQLEESVTEDSDDLSSTIIKVEQTRHDESATVPEEGFLNSGGTPDFATLRIAKSCSRKEQDEAAEDGSGDNNSILDLTSDTVDNKVSRNLKD